MNRKLRTVLACPVCKGTLQYRKRSAEFVCEKDRLAFPVRDGVPVLLVSDARRLGDKTPD